jgi:hypothetical protein
LRARGLDGHYDEIQTVTAIAASEVNVGLELSETVGAAGWWDPNTSDYTAALASGEIYSAEPVAWWAQVNGDFCGKVTWDVQWDGGETPPFILAVNNALFVCHPTYQMTTGLLTATATVRRGTESYTVDPITLVISDGY